jgi:hypothetical protein
MPECQATAIVAVQDTDGLVLCDQPAGHDGEHHDSADGSWWHA